MDGSEDLLNKYIYDYEAVVLRAIAYQEVPIKLLDFQVSSNLNSEGLTWTAQVNFLLLSSYPRNNEESNFHKIESSGTTLQEAGDLLYRKILTFCDNAILLVEGDRQWASSMIGRRVRHIKEQDGDLVVVWENVEGASFRRVDVPVPKDLEGLITEHHPGMVKIVFDSEIPGCTQELWVHRWKFEDCNHNEGNDLTGMRPYYIVI